MSTNIQIIVSAKSFIIIDFLVVYPGHSIGIAQGTTEVVLLNTSIPYKAKDRYKTVNTGSCSAKY